MIVHIQNTRPSVIKLLIKGKEFIKLLEHTQKSHTGSVAFPFASYNQKKIEINNKISFVTSIETINYLGIHLIRKKST